MSDLVPDHSVNVEVDNEVRVDTSVVLARNSIDVRIVVSERDVVVAILRVLDPADHSTLASAGQAELIVDLIQEEVTLTLETTVRPQLNSRESLGGVILILVPAVRGLLSDDACVGRQVCNRRKDSIDDGGCVRLVIGREDLLSRLVVVRQLRTSDLRNSLLAECL